MCCCTVMEMSETENRKPEQTTSSLKPSPTSAINLILTFIVSDKSAHWISHWIPFYVPKLPHIGCFGRQLVGADLERSADVLSARYSRSLPPLTACRVARTNAYNCFSPLSPASRSPHLRFRGILALIVTDWCAKR